ncbi:hypothetical protein WMY93_011369 [Mugilogobius chulae]|uniref:DNA-directed DNA polymerase n=1 Tax=Mugilogobius chulae TaxID=88201 RepID=A0AAW0PEF8_9GOBI
MGLELAFDFSAMYPSIMCALNISPETTIPWPPHAFPHDLSGCVCYSWQLEGFEYASLILKYDTQTGSFERQPAVFARSVEHYLNHRVDCKNKIKNLDIGQAERAYYKMKEGECKVLANSFYGTAPHPCGPLISAHGRQQIAIVNSCVSSFYQHCSPVIYGDTDSVMVSVGYGPGQAVESEVPNVIWDRDNGDANTLEEFSQAAMKALLDKFDCASQQVPSFLHCVHKTLVEDTLERMYFIGNGNSHQKVIRDPEGAYTDSGFPVYVVQVPGTEGFTDVTTPFIENRRVKLEHENSCSVYCHISKKAYVALTHNLDAKGAPLSPSVKIRGLTAIKSMRSPCDSAVTDIFIACVVRGDCIKLEADSVSCFTTSPWHQLQPGDVILYFKQEPHMDACGRWSELRDANSFLTPFKVQGVTTRPLDSGYCAVSVTLTSARLTGSASSLTHGLTVRTLYKDWKYCLNHIFSHKEAILRDLLMCKASELIASKMGMGFIPWSGVIKSAKTKNFSRETLDRLKVPKSSIKTTYAEIVTTRLREITGLSMQPTQCHEFYKCNPCEVAFYRYPLNLGARTGCLKAMFGHSLLCDVGEGASSSDRDIDLDSASDSETDLDNLTDNNFEVKSVSVNAASHVQELISHPYLPFSKCFSNSRPLLAHTADYQLVNRHGKLTSHCVVDFCLPRYMYSTALNSCCLDDCKEQLLILASSIRERLKRACKAFHTMMHNCPEHMIPTVEAREFEILKFNRETLIRLPGEKIQTCHQVIVEDMSLQPRRVYAKVIAKLGKMLTVAIADGVIYPVMGDTSSVESHWKNSISLTMPQTILKDAGIAGECGCKNFFKDLCANHVPGHKLIQYVYGSDKRRKIVEDKSKNHA